MNNKELKKKIVEILEEGYTPIEYDDGDWGQTYFPTNEDVADALIAAGIGDVNEAEHRAEVAELVVKNLNDIFTFDYQTVFEQAEKELEEERKDDNN